MRKFLTGAAVALVMGAGAAISLAGKNEYAGATLFGGLLLKF